MTDPSGGRVPATISGEVIRPTAYAGPVAASVFGLGQILKDVIHNTQVYRSEPQVLSAISAIDKWVSAHVKPSENDALATGDERAQVEDVSQRIPPSQPTVPGPIVNQVIDYDKLAAAIVRQQMQHAQPPQDQAISPE